MKQRKSPVRTKVRMGGDPGWKVASTRNLRVRTHVQAGGKTPKNCNPNPTDPQPIQM